MIQQELPRFRDLFTGISKGVVTSTVPYLRGIAVILKHALHFLINRGVLQVQVQKYSLIFWVRKLNRHPPPSRNPILFQYPAGDLGGSLNFDINWIACPIHLYSIYVA